MFLSIYLRSPCEGVISSRSSLYFKYAIYRSETRRLLHDNNFETPPQISLQKSFSSHLLRSLAHPKKKASVVFSLRKQLHLLCTTTLQKSRSSICLYKSELPEMVPLCKIYLLAHSLGMYMAGTCNL